MTQLDIFGGKNDRNTPSIPILIVFAHLQREKRHKSNANPVGMDTSNINILATIKRNDVAQILTYIQLTSLTNKVWGKQCGVLRVIEVFRFSHHQIRLSTIVRHD